MGDNNIEINGVNVTFDELVDAVRVHFYYGDDESPQVTELVRLLRLHWDERRVREINAAVSPKSERPVDPDILFVLYRIQPVMQWQMIARDYIPVEADA